MRRPNPPAMPGQCYFFHLALTYESHWHRLCPPLSPWRLGRSGAFYRWGLIQLVSMIQVLHNYEPIAKLKIHWKLTLRKLES
jgi:hypothetical protein